jgi:hypothetical protein
MMYSTRRGLFTRALLEGLRGEAAEPAGADGEHRVTAESLTRYVVPRVENLARREELSQRPTRKLDGDGRSLVLVERVKPVFHPVSITVSDPERTLVVTDDRGYEVERHPCGPAPVELRLRAGAYHASVRPYGAARTFRVGPGEPDVLDLERAG